MTEVLWYHGKKPDVFCIHYNTIIYTDVIPAVIEQSKKRQKKLPEAFRLAILENFVQWQQYKRHLISNKFESITHTHTHHRTYKHLSVIIFFCQYVGHVWLATLLWPWFRISHIHLLN